MQSLPNLANQAYTKKNYSKNHYKKFNQKQVWGGNGNKNKH